jgi:hypothetical protein
MALLASFSLDILLGARRQQARQPGGQYRAVVTTHVTAALVHGAAELEETARTVFS